MRRKSSTPNPITPTMGRPAMPRQFTGEAAAEWDRVCDELDTMGVLTTSDRSVISLYVKTWARWMKAEDEIEKTGEIVKAPNSKVPMQNPWVSIANKAHEYAVRLQGELGLTPRSRSIIAKNAAIGAGGGDRKPADDFADLET